MQEAEFTDDDVFEDVEQVENRADDLGGIAGRERARDGLHHFLEARMHQGDFGVDFRGERAFDGKRAARDRDHLPPDEIDHVERRDYRTGERRGARVFKARDRLAVLEEPSLQRLCSGRKVGGAVFSPCA